MLEDDASHSVIMDTENCVELTENAAGESSSVDGQGSSGVGGLWNISIGEAMNSDHMGRADRLVSHPVCSGQSDSLKRHLARSEKKRKCHKLKIAHQKIHRKMAKMKKKMNRAKLRNSITSEGGSSVDKTEQASTVLNKRERLKEIKQRLQIGMVSGQRICIDLGLEAFMSPKECGRLAQQLCRLYGSNRKASRPAHIYFTSVQRDGFLYKECLRKNVGFENYSIEMTDKSHLEMFKGDELVYLSPNSSNVLQSVDDEKVYVIGGLVDESVKKNVTQSRADQSGIETARLPISEYMDKAPSGSYNQILTVNQVFDILLAYMETSDWSVALPRGIPERKGFVIKEKS